MTTATPLSEPRPVTGLLDIDGRRYRLTGHIHTGSLRSAVIGTVVPLSAPAPFSRTADDAIIVVEAAHGHAL